MLKIKENVILLMLATAFLPGCYSVSTHTELEEVGSVDGQESVRVSRQNAGGGSLDAPGQATLLWEEPMVDVLDVPPGLDPEGHYYRPAHKSIVEIRQGRWQYYDRRKQK
jgi:hypothetical protein